MYIFKKQKLLACSSGVTDWETWSWTPVLLLGCEVCWTWDNCSHMLWFRRLYHQAWLYFTFFFFLSTLSKLVLSGWGVVVEPRSQPILTSPSTVWVLGNKLRWSGLAAIFTAEPSHWLCILLCKHCFGANEMSEQVNVCHTAWQPEPEALEPKQKMGGEEWVLKSVLCPLLPWSHPIIHTHIIITSLFL